MASNFFDIDKILIFLKKILPYTPLPTMVPKPQAIISFYGEITDTIFVVNSGIVIPKATNIPDIDSFQLYFLQSVSKHA